jgi:hypothetical protein
LKSSRFNKLTGLALGEKSLLVAEVAAGDRPQVRHLAELVYPEGISLQTPKELGALLAQTLREKEIGARSVIVGLPARWLLVKPKDVPSADEKTLNSMLRLQAEGDFSSELKDLVFDYADGRTVGPVTSVLVLATQRKYVDQIKEMCEAAKLKLEAITSTALVLGKTTGNALKARGGDAEPDVLVLSAAGGGTELTAQKGAAASTIRHMRSLEPRAPFVSEMRRAVSTMSAVSGEREMVIWDTHGIDANKLGDELGFLVRSGTLKSLGADDAGANGDGRRFAPAVALAMCGLTGAGSGVDFLDARLAPLPERHIPRWVILSVLSGIIIILGGYYAYNFTASKQADLDALNTQVANNKPIVDAAVKFNGIVAIARQWHAGTPQYLALYRDLDNAIPKDGVTFATSLVLKEAPKPPTTSSKPVLDNSRKLAGILEGKTSSQAGTVWLSIQGQLLNNKAFSNVKIQTTATLTRERMTSFEIDFQYDPDKAARVKAAN